MNKTKKKLILISQKMPWDVIQCTHLVNAERTENDLTYYMYMLFPD